MPFWQFSDSGKMVLFIFNLCIKFKDYFLNKDPQDFKNYFQLGLSPMNTKQNWKAIRKCLLYYIVKNSVWRFANNMLYTWKSALTFI